MLSEKWCFILMGLNMKVLLDLKFVCKCIFMELNCSIVDFIVLVLKMILIFKIELNERVLKCII